MELFTALRAIDRSGAFDIDIETSLVNVGNIDNLYKNFAVWAKAQQLSEKNSSRSRRTSLIQAEISKRSELSEKTKWRAMVQSLLTRAITNLFKATMLTL